MSPLFIAVTMVGMLISIVWILVIINSKQKKKDIRQTIELFNQAALDHTLYPTEKEVLGNLVIGIDPTRLMILVVKKRQENTTQFLVDLNQVEVCFMKEYFVTPAPEDHLKRKYDIQLDKIVLEFEFYDKNKSVAVSFYDSISHNLYEMAALKQKAVEWQEKCNRILLQKSKAVNIIATS